jgi:hypothetical protein
MAEKAVERILAPGGVCVGILWGGGMQCVESMKKGVKHVWHVCGALVEGCGA